MRVRCFVSTLVLALWLSVASAADGVSLGMDSEPGISQEQQLKELRKEKRRTMRGVHVMVDAGYMFELGSDIEPLFSHLFSEHEKNSRSDASKFAVSGTYGYQFNNFFFLGAGVGFEYYRVAHFISVPIFADARWTVINKPVSPWLGWKIGYGIGSLHGCYNEFSAGLTMRLRDGKGSLNCALVHSILMDMGDLKGFCGLGFRVGYAF